MPAANNQMAQQLFDQQVHSSFKCTSPEQTRSGIREDQAALRPPKAGPAIGIGCTSMADDTAL